MKSQKFYLIGSTLLFLSVGMVLWMSTLGFSTNLFGQWWSFLAFNSLVLALFVRPIISTRLPSGEKRILWLWVLFALWYQALSISSGVLRRTLYILGFLIAALSVYCATRIKDQRNAR